jgi:glycosyltransferase involved in cell wall biosynthesis
MKILMAEYHLWRHRIEVGEHKYAHFFLEDGQAMFWLAHFLNINRLIRRREDDRAYVALWRQGVVSPEPNLMTFTPFSLLPYVRVPILQSYPVAKACLKYTVPNVKRTLAQQGFAHVDVLWIGNPRLYSLLSLVSWDVLVYRMSDDWDTFPLEPETTRLLEAEIFRRADVVFATAKNLVAKAEKMARRVCYLPNGVDFDLFNAAQLDIPDDLARISEPRIIFVGNIEDWMDFAALEYAAQQLSTYSFVIIGPVSGGAPTTEGLARLRAQPNVHILGSRPFAQIPRYLQHSQVGVIPFVKNNLTDAVNPIKLFEYAAAGLPMVSRDLVEVRHLASPALLYATSEEFVACLEEAMQNRQRLSTAGVAFGRANAWAQRYTLVKRELAEIMAARE